MQQASFQKEICREVTLASGQVVQVLAKNGVVTLVPDCPLSSLRGFLKSMQTNGVREKERS